MSDQDPHSDIKFPTTKKQRPFHILLDDERGRSDREVGADISYPEWFFDWWFIFDLFGCTNRAVSKDISIH